ncbi:MAG: hypothetical protein P4N41_05945 [Negativicutes bacterium]|nr:hypothetical protein [Negativicutes bacterium]
MKSLAKKAVVYSLVAILQCGIGAATLEASPRHDNQPSQARDNRDRHEQQRYENNERDRHDREIRQREENERHEREMQRRHHESEREWRERQHQENERHDQLLQDIGIAAVVYMLLNHD